MASVQGESPGGKPMGAGGIALVTIYLVAVAIVVFHNLVVLWPPNRDNRGDNQDIAARLDRIEKALGQPTGREEPTEDWEPAPGEGQGTTGDPLVTDGTPEPESPEVTTDLPGTDMTEEPRGTDLEGDSGREAGDGATGEGEAACEEGQRSVKLFWVLDFCLSDEERLFLIVMFSGALGGLVHSLRSFYWYAGQRKLVLSWTGFYITLPVLGAALATVFYLVVRGGFFSPQSQISDTSPFGFAALGALIGMFTEQAVKKLKQVAETFFAQAEQGKDRAEPAPTATGITPNQGPQAGGTAVTVTGTGFAQNATVTFGGQPATSVQVTSDGKSITAVAPAASAPGPVTVEVTNPDKQKSSLKDGFTYI